MSPGPCAIPKGRITRVPQSTDAVETSSPDESPSLCWLKSEPAAYEIEARITASVPIAPAQPPSGLTPTSTPTPMMPRTSPKARTPVTRSCRANRIASSATKMGIDALPIAAIPESILVWPQAISQNGSAVLITPSTTPAQPKSRRQRTAWRKPRFATRTAPSAAEAKSSRPVMVAAGERSSIAISMNMNDEPQIRARTSSRGT